MPDLNVIAIIRAKPGSESVLEQALSELATATRNEEGCLAYDLYRSSADGTAFVTIERWRAQADLDAHMQTAHVAKAFQAAGEAIAEAPAIHPLQPVG